MARKLKDILPSIILVNQGGFIKGKRIWDNIILVQQAIHSSMKNGEKGMVVKIDLANTFDKVSHPFLLNVMERYGFDTSFISWVKACINLPWIAPLINGRVTSFFPSHARIEVRLPTLTSALCNPRLCS